MTNTTYADRWADEINRVYHEESQWDTAEFVADMRGTLEVDEVVYIALGKAARALRNGEVVTFSGQELDIVRYFMPAHEVHQSGSVRWVLDRFGFDPMTEFRER